MQAPVGETQVEKDNRGYTILIVRGAHDEVKGARKDHGPREKGKDPVWTVWILDTASVLRKINPKVSLLTRPRWFESGIDRDSSRLYAFEGLL
jgi:hypothetical protein